MPTCEKGQATEDPSGTVKAYNYVLNQIQNGKGSLRIPELAMWMPYDSYF